jgi:hypothetical protein
MQYIRESDIRRRNAVYESVSQRFLFSSASESAKAHGVFVSHSHIDSKIAGQLANYVSTFGVPVYVDIFDTELPDRPSSETAELLRKQIGCHPKFVALMSEKALSSRWIPWELGYADGRKEKAPIPSPDVALFPVLCDAWTLPGAEYMALYPQVKQDGNEVYLALPDGSRGPKFGDWLRSTPQSRAMASLFE